MAKLTEEQYAEIGRRVCKMEVGEILMHDKPDLWTLGRTDVIFPAEGKSALGVLRLAQQEEQINA